MSDEEVHQICKQKDILFVKSFFGKFKTLLNEYHQYLSTDISISNTMLNIDNAFIEYIGSNEYLYNANEMERILMHKIIFYLFCLQLHNIIYLLCKQTSEYIKMINIISKKMETVQKLLNEQNGGNLFCYKLYKTNYITKNKYRDKLLYKMNKYLHFGLLNINI
ncbi:hypothetical protein BMW23_0246 [Bodo saltans virus]|uniref:Uncharacterized protein n=1 Tax=Bodo saltans virus TaxID=2024608 RepID=A0A2H4UTV7_9VIRU|nr:hypothetical protein QJ851_gp0241 [Bodo saltans virus]ATZ80304.1 hypothetical protein BMW23_0246 [Bodo saltans virus]